MQFCQLVTRNPDQAHRVRRCAVLAVVLGVALLAVVDSRPAWSQSTERVDRARDSVEGAATKLRGVRAELDEAVRQYQAIVGRSIEIEDRIAALDVQMATVAARRDEMEGQLAQSAADLYMSSVAPAGPLTLGTSSLEQAVVASQLIGDSLAEQDDALADMAALSADLGRLNEQRSRDLEALEPLLEEASILVSRIDALFGEASVEYAGADAELHAAQQALAEEQRRRERERQRATPTSRGSTATAGPPRGDIACPMTPVGFTNDWGAPRSGGRKHQGNDLFAPYGQAVVAVTDGVVRAKRGGLGGITLWLNGDDGVSYYYAHLSGWADGIQTGTRVSRGQIIGFNGNSGNASGTAAHVHFQIHPGGGSPINPYSTLRRACG